MYLEPSRSRGIREVPFGEWTFSRVVNEAMTRSARRKVLVRGRPRGCYREYFDAGSALLQLGFTAKSPAKVFAKRI